jgi:hypothetical protein
MSILAYQTEGRVFERLDRLEPHGLTQSSSFSPSYSVEIITPRDYYTYLDYVLSIMYIFI